MLDFHNLFEVMVHQLLAQPQVQHRHRRTGTQQDIAHESLGLIGGLVAEVAEGLRLPRERPALERGHDECEGWGGHGFVRPRGDCQMEDFLRSRCISRFFGPFSSSSYVPTSIWVEASRLEIEM